MFTNYTLSTKKENEIISYKSNNCFQKKILIPVYSFMIDDEIFSVQETNEWNLSPNKNFTYQATTIYTQTIADNTLLPIVLSYIIAQFVPCLEEQTGIDILNDKGRPDPYVLIDGNSLDFYIKKEIAFVLGPMVLVQEVNAKNGTLNVIPLVRVEYVLSKVYIYKNVFFSFDFDNEKPDSSIQNQKQSAFHMSFSLIFKGNRNEYILNSSSLNELQPSNNVIVKLLSEKIEHISAIKIGCSKNLITLGFFVYEFQPGQWTYTSV